MPTTMKTLLNSSIAYTQMKVIAELKLPTVTATKYTCYSMLGHIHAKVLMEVQRAVEAAVWEERIIHTLGCTHVTHHKNIQPHTQLG